MVGGSQVCPHLNPGERYVHASNSSSQPGFVDDLEIYAGKQFISLTFWETEEDAERFTREVFPPIAARSARFVVIPLEWRLGRTSWSRTRSIARGARL